MPTGQNWINYIFINLAFLVYMISLVYMSSIQDIRKNWALYRCNPMYMPLSDNVGRDFTHCVQNIQVSSMGPLLQPLTNITGSLTNVVSGFTEDLNNVRNVISSIRFNMGGIFGLILGVFANVVLEFQKITIAIKDMMGKNIGVMSVFMNIMDGSFKTVGSMWNGPTGGLVRTLGKCFHPETSVRLKNGQIVFMKDLNLGDVLENGSIVESTMRINNKTNPEQLYVLKGSGVNGVDIYVTGSHFIYNKRDKKFIPVSTFDKAEITNKQTDWFSCLITSDHKIQIGSEVFWDWEDHVCKKI
jgi:hypothetical protein